MILGHCPRIFQWVVDSQAADFRLAAISEYRKDSALRQT